MEIECLHTFDTEYSADSVEWCRVAGLEDFFVVGTYQLEEKDEKVSANNVRKGRVYLFSYDGEANELVKRQQIETDAILDQKWDGKQLVTATSLGFIQRYKMNDNQELEKVGEIEINNGESGNLALSIDIREDSKILASDSKGRITLIDPEAETSIVSQWQGHGFEAWTCAFDRWNHDIVYSGGDDSIQNIWDLRTSSKVKSTRRDAGVTSFLNHKENFLFVGSYDEHLSLYDLRNLKRSLDEINLQGGIWRIKPSSITPNLLLVACMYHNFSIVDTSKELQLVGEFFGHDSICYGCDWSLGLKENCQVFASCSFYDHKLSVCKVKV